MDPVIERGLIWGVADSQLITNRIKNDDDAFYGPSNCRLGNELNAGAYVSFYPYLQRANSLFDLQVSGER